MTVHLLGAGDAVEWTVALWCYGSAGGSNFRYPEGRVQQLSSAGGGESQGGTLDIPLIGWPIGQVESCSLSADSEAGHYSVSPPDLPASDAHLTWNLTEDRVLVGTPGVSVDDDGVLDTVESQGPNDGDGNNDGVPGPSSRTTSPRCPPSGDDPGSGRQYMTIAGPVGSKFVQCLHDGPGVMRVDPTPGWSDAAGMGW